MFKNYLILLLTVFLLSACSKNPFVSGKAEIVAEPTEEEMILALYSEAVEALKIGDAYFASKKFKEVESLLHKVIGQLKQVLWLVTQIIQEMHMQIVSLV